IARTKALLRRPGSALGTLLTAGNISFDTIGRDVRVIDAAIALPRRELAIFEHLMRRLGRVVPKTPLQGTLFGVDDERESNAIPVHVHHLRRRLQDAGATVQIHTVRGRRLPARRIEGVMRSRPRSLQVRLALRVATLYILATLAVIAVLMTRAYDTARSL